jgi:hypothetical protein
VAASVFGSAPLLGWVEGHRALLGDGMVAAVAAWHGAMHAAGLDAPYAGIRGVVQRIAGTEG